MKKLIYFKTLFIFFAFIVTGCKKDNNFENKIQNNSNSFKSGLQILTFNDYDELDKKMELLHMMNEDERRSNESNDGFKSLLTHVYETYEILNADRYDSTSTELYEIAIKFQQKNAELFTIRDDGDKDKEFHIHYSDNKYAIVANIDRLFIVENMVFKVFDDGLVGTDKENIDLLNKISEISIKNVAAEKNILIIDFNNEDNSGKTSCHASENENIRTNQRNRTKLTLVAKQFITSINQNTAQVFRRVETWGKIKPQHRTAGIWFAARRTISGRIKYHVQYLNGVTHNINVNETVNPNLSYSQTRFLHHSQPVNTSASNIRFISIDSWGDTPSTPTATVVCQ